MYRSVPPASRPSADSSADLLSEACSAAISEAAVGSLRKPITAERAPPET